MAFEQMMVALLFVVVAFRAFLSPAQNDTYWTLRAGADIWRTGHVPLADTYSYTVTGQPWPDHEWLWQAFVYGLHRLGGMPLVTLGAGALILLAMALAYRLTIGPATTRFVVAAIGICLVSCVWALRPQVVTLLAVTLLATLLVRERFWPIPLLFLAWANAHGGVSLGGLVLLAATAAALLRWYRSRSAADARRARALAIVLPLAGLATCATPLGIHIFRFVWDSTARLYAAHITEWRPTLPFDLVGALFWLGALAFLSVLLWRRRALPEAPWSTWAVTAGALVLLPPAFRSIRNYAPFAMLAIPATSHLLGADFRFRLPGRRRERPPSPDHPRLNLALFSLFALPAAGLVAAAYATAYPWLDWRPLPAAAIAAVRSCDGPLFNHYDDGGALIWFVPERPVFVDSRQDPYPLPFLLQGIRVERGEEPYQPLFARWGIRCALLRPSSKLGARLRADGWRPRFTDERWAVIAAPGAAPR